MVYIHRKINKMIFCCSNKRCCWLKHPFAVESEPPLSDNAFFDYRDNFTIIQNDAIYRDNIAIIFKH